MTDTIAADLSPRAYERASQYLSGLDADWARHIANVGPCRHEAKPAREPYEALVRAIAYQQLHAKAGDAILARLLALYPGASFPSPAQLLSTDPDLQRACGFSAAKLATIRGIAQAAVDGIVPSLDEARRLPDAALIERLVSLRGVGRWTVEMFLIYSLERSDVLPVDDFGVREGYRRLKGLEKAPTPRQMREIGGAWRPWRTVAAWYLWRLPSSPARLPKRENVEFFDPAKAAEAAGYRPSRRARGDQTSAAAERAALVERACRLIEASETPPQLDDLAAEIGMSPFHFHRLFKAETGLTPKAYNSAYRARKLREELSTPDASVTNAIYGAGFNSNTRIYEASDHLLGMRARDYLADGTGTVIRFAVGQCSLGAILVAQSQRGICAILLGDDPDALVRDLQDQFRKAQLIGGDAEFEQSIAQVVGFIEAPAIGLHLPLDVQGTAFQERVWRVLREIPPGTTVSYAEIAERIGAPKAVRAVAQACAANHIAVAIPCHRVVRRDGDIAGYRWGVDRKRELLRREAQT